MRMQTLKRERKEGRKTGQEEGGRRAGGREGAGFKRRFKGRGKKKGHIQNSEQPENPRGNTVVPAPHPIPEHRTTSQSLCATNPK